MGPNIEYLNWAMLAPHIMPYADYLPNDSLVMSEAVVYKPQNAQVGLASESLPEEPLGWLCDCLNFDEACSEARDIQGIDQFLPSRLLDLTPDSSSQPCLIDTRETAIQHPKYVALSHRWPGSHSDPQLELTTTSDTLQIRMNSIDPDKLSKTYRFAIDICRWLGIRYLWIDSFCIIQDSKSDWDAESSTMGRVYQCSYCTISINIPETHEKPLWTHCGYIGKEAEGWVVESVNSGSWKTTASSLWMALLAGGMLGSRAWCLQEQQLSPRILHFLDPGMIMFECCNFVAAIGGPVVFGVPGTHFRDTKPDNEKRIIDIERNTEPEVLSYAKDKVMGAWYKLLTDYTSRLLTRETDRPIAILGLVNQVKAMSGFKYVCGIWGEDTVRGLLWERHASIGDVWGRPLGVICSEYPTWSWLSICGPIKDAVGNDEDSNPPLFAETRNFRPVFDHSYSPASLIEFSQDNKRVIITGPSLSARLDYQSSESGIREWGRKVMVKKLGDPSTGVIVGWACLDIPSENYHGQVTLAILTNWYGLLLSKIGDFESYPLYRRLGVVRNPREHGGYRWNEVDFTQGFTAVI